MAHDLTLDLIGAAALVVLAVCLTGWLTRDVGRPEHTVSWARAHGLVVTPANAGLVVWWVRLSGTLRVVGGVSGLVLGSLVDDAFAVNTSAGAGFWAWIVLGWVAGGVWAWEAVSRDRREPATASLVPRRLEDYAPPVARWGPPIAAVITVAVAVSGRWLGPADPALGGGRDAQRWLLAGAAVVLAVVARLLLARVVARRQRADVPDEVAADDAIRATTVHLVAGGITGAILLLGVITADVVLGPRQLPFGLRGWVPFSLLVAAAISSRFLANRPWQVRRATALDQRVPT